MIDDVGTCITGHGEVANFEFVLVIIAGTFAMFKTAFHTAVDEAEGEKISRA